MGNSAIFLAVPISILTAALATTVSRPPQELVSSPHAETRMLALHRPNIHMTTLFHINVRVRVRERETEEREREREHNHWQTDRYAVSFETRENATQARHEITPWSIMPTSCYFNKHYNNYSDSLLSTPQ